MNYQFQLIENKNLLVYNYQHLQSNVLIKLLLFQFVQSKMDEIYVMLDLYIIQEYDLLVMVQYTNQ
jgi:hypothetical protein